MSDCNHDGMVLGPEGHETCNQCGDRLDNPWDEFTDGEGPELV